MTQPNKLIKYVVGFGVAAGSLFTAGASVSANSNLLNGKINNIIPTNLMAGKKHARVKLASQTNDTLPDGISISNPFKAHENFNQYNGMATKTEVEVTKTDATINPGDSITLNVAYDPNDPGSTYIMRRNIDWNNVNVTGGSKYGYVNVNKNRGTITYVFTKQITKTTGHFSFTANVPFKSGGQLAGVKYSSTFNQGNKQYEVTPASDGTYFGYIPFSPQPVSKDRVQAPSLLPGLDYTGVKPFDGPSANAPVGSQWGSDHGSYFDPAKGDQPSFVNVAYPTNATRDDKFNALTGRKYTSTFYGKDVKVNANNLMFGFPPEGVYALPYGKQYAGQWITLNQMKALFPGIKVNVDNSKPDEASMTIEFPDGMPIQYLQWTANIVAPDVGGTYYSKFTYSDNQHTDSNTVLTGNPDTGFYAFKYQTNDNHGFFPVINADNKSINLSDFNGNLDDILRKDVSVSDAQDGNADTSKLQIDDAGLKKALANHQTGTYQVTYSVKNSVGLTAKSIVNVTVYSNIEVDYQDQNGKTIKDSTTIPGGAGETYNVNIPNIDGYQYLNSNVASLSGSFGDPDQPSKIILTYQKVIPSNSLATGKISFVDKANGKTISSQIINQKIGPNGNNLIKLEVPNGYHLPDGVSDMLALHPGDNSQDIEVIAEANEPDNSGSNESGSNDSASNDQSGSASPRNDNSMPLGTKVSALRALNMYRKANLTGKKFHVKKAKRTHRPVFVVKKVSKTQAGTPRYYVKQVKTHRSGWVTGNRKFITKTFYQPRQKSVKFRILRRSGLNSYKTKSLKGKAKHFRYGKTLKAKRIVKKGLITRFQLKDGRYVSANKGYVIFK